MSKDVKENSCELEFDDIPEYSFNGFEHNPRIKLELFKELVEKNNHYKGIINDEGENFFMFICKTSTLENIKYLIEHNEQNYDINQTDEGGYSPLRHACSDNTKDVIEYLYKIGAKDQMEKDNWTLLHYAAMQNKNVDVIEFMCSKYDYKAVTEDNETPFLLACKFNVLPVVKMLFQKNLSDDYLIDRDIDGMTCLHHAAISNNVDVVKFLIENKFDVNAKDNEGFTPLYYAVIYDKLEIVEYLINETNVDLEIEYKSVGIKEEKIYVLIYVFSKEGDETYSFLNNIKIKKEKKQETISETLSETLSETIS